MGRLLIALLGLAVCGALAGCTSSGSAVSSGPTVSTSGPVTSGPVTAGKAPSMPASSTHGSPDKRACPPAFRRIVDRGTGDATISEHDQRSPTVTKCTYLVHKTARTVRTARTACSKAVVLVTTAPSAFIDFQRWAVETGQVASWTHHPALNPRTVPHIGIEADWVLATETFETATQRSWVAVFLTCAPRSAADRRLGIALGRAGLAAPTSG